MPGHASGLLERPAKQILDLAVEAAQLLGGPPLQGFVYHGIQAEQECLALCHELPAPAGYG